MKIIFAATGMLLVLGLGGATPARAFDQRQAEQLKTVHDRLLADYPTERKKDLNAIVPTLFYFKLAAALEDAGVKALLDDGNAGLVTPATRIAILNDYGFWLSKAADPRNAVPVLLKVVELAPTRAVVELNLADAARSVVGSASTWERKNEFAAIGLQAYAAYRRLSGKDAPAAKAFQELRAAASGTTDVCSYVALFYNRGREADMWGYPDPVDIASDGKLRHVYLFDEGTAHVPVLFASTNAVSEEDRWAESDKEPAEVDFKLTTKSSDDDRTWHDELHILPFKQGYYVVYQDDGGPVAVVKPNAGTVCLFERRFTPVLAEDRASAICKDALVGKAFDRVPDISLPSRNIRTGDIRLDIPGGGDTTDVQRYANVTLDPLGGPARIGYFEIGSGAGRGCDLNGIAFLDDQGLEKSSRSKAWIEMQAKLLSCGSTAFPVRTNGETFIEIDAGAAFQRSQPPRSLLRLRADRFETVCRVEQRPTYIVEPVAKPH